ncbi:MAG: addiction module protein [Xanthomonadaceae bacterium]|nr:addiction module protein [Xanthomonadaceae bacterium]
MAANLKDIEDRIAQLSSEDRSRLIQGLIRSLDTGDDVDSEAAWLNVAEQRYQDYRAGKLTSKSAEKVFKEARSKLK